MANKWIEQIKQQEGSNPYQKFVDAQTEGKMKNTNIKELTNFVNWLKIEKFKNFEFDFKELYQIGVDSQNSDEPNERLMVLDLVAEYIQHVNETQVSEVSGKTYSYGKGKAIKQSVLKFFSANGVYYKIERNHKLNKITKRKNSKLRKPSKEEIRNLISVCPNFRDKAIVSLSKESGLRVSDLAQIQYKHVKDGLNSVDGFGGFSLSIEKTDREALAVFGYETTNYLRLWVDELETRLGRDLTDNDYIFCLVKDSDKKGNKSTATNWSSLINNQIKKLGLEHQISANGLRYFFESNLELVLNQNLIKKIQGKQIEDSTRSYSKHDVEEMLTVYKSAYQVLTVEGETTQTKQAEIEVLKSQLSRIEEQNIELESLREYIRKYQNKDEETFNEELKQIKIGTIETSVGKITQQEYDALGNLPITIENVKAVRRKLDIENREKSEDL